MRESNLNSVKFAVEGETNKSYYVSKESFVKRGDAIQACAAFDLSLAAPLNQDEYDNLKMLVKEHEMYEWIDGYRSQSNKEEWQVAGAEIPYDISWGEGEPNNARSAEDCFGKKINLETSRHSNLHFQLLEARKELSR